MCCVGSDDLHCVGFLLVRSLPPVPPPFSILTRIYNDNNFEPIKKFLLCGTLIVL